MAWADGPGAEDVHAALASPVRRRVLAALRSDQRGRSAAELAADEGLHVTTVRFHLDHLMRAGLVTAEAEPAARRGRPSLRYSAALPDAAGASGADTAGADPRDGMIDALAQAAAGGGTPDDARAAGRRWASASQLLRSSLPAVDAVFEALTSLGFDPVAAQQTPGPEDVAAGLEATRTDAAVTRVRARIDLRSCPFRAAAHRAPQVVCEVHAGFLQEVVARAADGAGAQAELVPFATPTTCRVHLTPARPARVPGARRAPSSPSTQEQP